MAERTSKKAASAAGKTLTNPKASRSAKSAAASALAQTGNNKVTGKKAGTAASKALSSSKGSKAGKSAAGSALTQRPTRRK